MSSYVKQYLPPVGRQNATVGYSLAYALKHPRKGRREPALPNGWRWLKVGESTKEGDVACGKEIPPVKILIGGDVITPAHHPVRRARLSPSRNDRHEAH